MAEERPNPEKLLKQAQQEEHQEKIGKLKIYLGAAPGVGKTYTMLQDAIAKRSQGLDVVVGVVETHGRQEINALLKNLETLPRQEVNYRGQTLAEFDLDAALKRHPGLILIDEMAHTNVPGLRHEKRWQDIKEILDRGIDVYTTLNIQHIESLNDVVSQIIHAPIKETVPDYMLEIADTVELVDLPPEDLLKRLQEGKVYIPKQAEMAIENFFRKGNLIALRELALRTTAERVGEQVLLYRQGQGIKHIWPTKDKILVCVGSRASSTKLIRAARRMTTSLQAEWVAVHIETSRIIKSDEERNQVIQNLRLAEQLGAETRVITGADMVKEVLAFAHEQNVTQIMIGKQYRARWKDILFGSLADELVRQSGEIDVYIITGESINEKTKKPISVDKAIPWGIYGISVGIVIIATLINIVLESYLSDSNLIMVYLLGVTFIALYGRTGPSILASILSILAYGFFFSPSLIPFDVTKIQYLFTLLVMLLVVQIISHLTIVTRRQAASARLTEKRTATLHMLSRQLSGTRGVDKLLETAVRFLSEVFDSDVLVLLNENNHLIVRTSYKVDYVLNAKEQGVAQWVFDMSQMAGLGTDTLPFADAIYVPLLTLQGSIGVLRIHPFQSEHLFTPEQMHLLEACANQIALAIEVDRMQEQTNRSALRVETDRVRNALLHAVSHDLHTPLTAIMGSASTLIEMNNQLDASKIKKLGNDIYAESEQLNRLINNILQISYLEAEEVELQKKMLSLSEVIHFVLNALKKKIGKKQISLHLPDNLPLIPFDRTLIQEVFLNLIDNAIKFTPPETPIDIYAFLENNRVVISVEDRGPGIVPDEVNKLFEKFYRGRMLTTERGLGLGLAICRNIIEVHGGKIWAANRLDGGAIFRFTLPL